MAKRKPRKAYQQVYRVYRVRDPPHPSDKTRTNARLAASSWARTVHDADWYSPPGPCECVMSAAVPIGMGRGKKLCKQMDGIPGNPTRSLEEHSIGAIRCQTSTILKQLFQPAVLLRSRSIVFPARRRVYIRPCRRCVYACDRLFLVRRREYIRRHPRPRRAYFRRRPLIYYSDETFLPFIIFY
jgi:hypothetical protein